MTNRGIKVDDAVRIQNLGSKFINPLEGATGKVLGLANDVAYTRTYIVLLDTPIGFYGEQHKAVVMPEGHLEVIN